MLHFSDTLNDSIIKQLALPENHAYDIGLDLTRLVKIQLFFLCPFTIYI